MSKLTISPVLAGYRSAEALTENFEAIEATLEKTLSRDGTAPNQMEANLDMNGNRILNLPEPESSGEPARLADIEDQGDRIDALESSVTGLTSDVISLEGEVDTHETRLDGIDAALAPPPLSINRTCFGAVTPTSFVFSTDTNRACDVGLVVSTNNTFTGIVQTISETASTAWEGLTTTYHGRKMAVTGLTANTLYYVAVTLNGTRQATYQVRTAPAAMAATSFRFGVGSCFQPSSTKISQVWRAIAQREHAFFVQIGDLYYSDVDTDDIRRCRDNITRVARATEDFREAAKTVAMVHIPDDHDNGGANDNHYDTFYPSQATNAQLCQNARDVMEECWPHYPWALDATFAQTFDWGRTRHVLMDCHWFLRWTTGTTTRLGTDNNPPGSPDQLQWVLDQIADAEADGVKLLCLYSTATWTGTWFESWDQRTPAEQQLLCDAINASGVAVLLWSGDDHQLGFDAGTNTDRSTDRDTKFPQINSSGMNQYGWRNLAGPYIWQGVEAEVEGNAQVFVELEVEDNGGNDFRWEVRGYGAPINQTTFEPTLLTCGEDQTAEFASDDEDVEVGFGGLSELFVVDGEPLALTKSWFGPVGGCSVDYTDGGPNSGTVTFLPNQNRKEITISGLTAPDDVTLTLSNNVRCEIPEPSILLKVRDMHPMTAAYLNAMTVAPDEDWFQIYDDFIVEMDGYGLLDDKHFRLWFMAAHDEQAAKINLVSPGIGDLIETGSVPWTLGQGFNTPGTAGNYLRTQFTMGVDGLGADGYPDHSFWCWNLLDANPSATSPIMGAKFWQLTPKQSGGGGTARIRDGGGGGKLITATDSLGMILSNRTDAETFQGWRGNSSSAMAQTTGASGTSPYAEPLTNSYETSEMWIGGASASGYGAWTPAFAGIGRGLTSTEITNLRTAILNALTAIAAL